MEDILLKGLRKLNRHVYENICVDYDPRKKLNFTQMQIIKYLKNNKDVCQKDLEEETKLNKASISGALDSLQKLKAIKRKQSETDKRKNIIVLTDEVDEMFAELDNRLAKVKKIMCKDISEKDLAKFQKTLDKMLENLNGGKE